MLPHRTPSEQRARRDPGVTPSEAWFCRGHLTHPTRVLLTSESKRVRSE
jgi:hypothetical protein